MGTVRLARVGRSGTAVPSVVPAAAVAATPAVLQWPRSRRSRPSDARRLWAVALPASGARGAQSSSRPTLLRDPRCPFPRNRAAADHVLAGGQAQGQWDATETRTQSRTGRPSLRSVTRTWNLRLVVTPQKSGSAVQRVPQAPPHTRRPTPSPSRGRRAALVRPRKRRRNTEQGGPNRQPSRWVTPHLLPPTPPHVPQLLLLLRPTPPGTAHDTPSPHLLNFLRATTVPHTLLVFGELGRFQEDWSGISGDAPELG